MSEEKTKVLIPFRQPISIMNQTQPGEEEGEVVPVPIHIIVDNAADFPVCDCGGGGGNVKHLVLLPDFARAVDGMCDEDTEYMVIIVKPDTDSLDIRSIMIPFPVGEPTVFVVEPDTSYFMYIIPDSGTMTFDSEIGVQALDVDNNVDLTAVCFPYDEDNNRYSIYAEENAVEIEFSIPSFANNVGFYFGGGK